MKKLEKLPLIVVLMGIGALAMYVPAFHAMANRAYFVARAFFYSGTLFLVLTILLGVATISHVSRHRARDQLMTLVVAYTLLPAMLAVPLSENVRDTSFLNAWWEMVSAFSTTGASLFEPSQLAESVHLWRALVGWMGGGLMLVAAVAILAPLNLGGFEVLTGGGAGQTFVSGAQVTGRASVAERVRRQALSIIPVYAALTALLWIGLIMAGDSAFVAICHAMSVLSTSGISPVGGLSGAHSGLTGEMMMLVLMIFGLSRKLYPSDRTFRKEQHLLDDPELRLAVLILTVVPALLFLRHWVGALGEDEIDDTRAAFGALWGTVFTVLSFLTTTGFESIDWGQARNWSGLATPGLILVGLAVIGGGVATTAGGVKLLRVYALYRHGEREVERLVHPSSLGGAGTQARRLRRQGAQMAWIFFMLFALSIAVTMLFLSLTGLDFEASTIFAVSALSTTGPLASFAGSVPLAWSELDGAARAITAAAMVLGRLETLAIIALLNPDFWRS
ncbi:MAG: TrkH family potassium uptake protein [Rhodobacteraceae bacterium]|nr:TrkH family potassium uptake protein [Paracoccaceae bacterium]